MSSVSRKALMRRFFLVSCSLFCGASPVAAESIYVIDGKIEIALPEGYHVTPNELITTDGEAYFSGPADDAEINEALSKYTGEVTTEEYFEKVVFEEFASEHEDIDTDYIKRNLKSVSLNILEIVPDNMIDVEPDRLQIPESETRDMNELCENFSTEFESRWGQGAFHVFDEVTGICHNINVFGALIAVHVAKVDSYLITVESIDWSLALMPDYLDADRFGRPVVLKNEFDFENASTEQKFAEFRDAANTDHVVAIPQSAKSIAQ